MGDDANSCRVMARMLGLPGFVVLATHDARGDLKLSAVSRLQRTECPVGGAVYSCDDRLPEGTIQAVNSITESTRRCGQAFRSCSSSRHLRPRGGVRWDNRPTPRLGMRKLRLVA